MKRYEFIMYPPSTNIPMKNACVAQNMEAIKHDKYISQLLSSGWTLGKVLIETEI